MRCALIDRHRGAHDNNVQPRRDAYAWWGVAPVRRAASEPVRLLRRRGLYWPLEPSRRVLLGASRRPPTSCSVTRRRRNVLKAPDASAASFATLVRQTWLISP